MYVITVEFKVAPNRVEEFMKHMLMNAASSFENEPGCDQFDVCVDPSSLETVFLYERYKDRDAFDAHLATHHFRTFDEAVKDMVVEKKIRVWELVSIQGKF